MRTFSHRHGLPVSAAIALLVMLLVPAGAWTGLQAAEICGGPLQNNNFGRPIDYRDQVGEAMALELVESAHFNANVEALIEGQSGRMPMDIDYTLRQIPNHYRALDAMARWDLSNPRRPDADYWPIECYFERAFAFTPEDPNLYLLYAVYLHRAKDYDEALKMYRRAEEQGSESVELQYNMGLVLFEKKDYELAREYAVKAYAGGYPLPGLKNKLKRAGKW